MGRRVAIHGDGWLIGKWVAKRQTGGFHGDGWVGKGDVWLSR
jgi:hypothetical protein